MTMLRVLFGLAILAILPANVDADVAAAGDDAAPISFRLTAEISLGAFGGIPFCADLDADGRTDILWLQSPGLFHSLVFDVAPWKGKWSETERNHFALTATDAKGKILWQLGEPWRGSRPFVTHSAERALDVADIDGDGRMEVVCVRRSELLVLDAQTGELENSRRTLADNVQIVQVGRTDPRPSGWTIIAKNAEGAYPPHEYANPAWFYSNDLELLKTVDYLGAGHAPKVIDVDDDGLDEFLIGYSLVESDLSRVWSFQPVAATEWSAAQMHVDHIAFGLIGGRSCVGLAASDTAYLLDARDGSLIWKRRSTHPQHCQIGRFDPARRGSQVFIHNKRAELRLYDAAGEEIWQVMPPKNFPLGEAAPCRRQKFHVFDPTTLLPEAGPDGEDLLVFTDAGWPYVIDGRGERALEFPYTPNVAQDWGEVPGRPDDYGYGFYARTGDFDGDGDAEVLINDRRYAWFYEIDRRGLKRVPPRADGRVLNADLENYTDGVVQAVNAGVRWLGDPFSGRDEGTATITRGFAYRGSRCAHVQTTRPDQIARVRLQRRFDAASVAGDGDEVGEVVFRPARTRAVDLEDLTVWRGRSASGENVGLMLVAVGTASSGTYRLDTLEGGEDGPRRVRAVASALQQDRWLRVLQHRRRAAREVDLWLGPPGAEEFIGTYRDLGPGRELAKVEVGDTETSRARGSGYWDDFRIGAPLGANALPAPPEPPLRDVSREVAPVSEPIRVGRERQLFVDDGVIAELEDVERRLHAVNKHAANPLITPTEPWEGTSVLLYGSVVFDPEMRKFRMWYLAWGKHVGQPSFLCYAESDDGLQWVKPKLDIHPFAGRAATNILFPVRSQITIIYDPRDPDPSRRYKGAIRASGTRAIFSADGLHWRDGGILLEQCYDSTSVHWDPLGEKWIASVKIFRHGKRARGYAESRDFDNWTDTYLMATVDERDTPGDEMYALSICRYESVYLGFLRMYDTETDKIDIQLAASRNAKSWQRPLREPFIPTSPKRGDWDFGNNAMAKNPPLRVGDELWFYYSGRSTLHNEVPNTGAIGLGTLRVDGFVSVEAGSEPGTLRTRPIVLDGKELHINAEVDPGGWLQVMSTDGQSSLPIRSGGVNVRIPWKNDRAPVGRVTRLTFSMKNARLYSFWSE